MAKIEKQQSVGTVEANLDISEKNQTELKSTIAYSHILFRIPIIGLSLYRLVLRDRSGQQTLYQISRENPAGLQGEMTRLLQKGCDADGNSIPVRWTAMPLDDSYEEGAQRIERFDEYEQEHRDTITYDPYKTKIGF